MGRNLSYSREKVPCSNFRSYPHFLSYVRLISGVNPSIIHTASYLTRGVGAGPRPWDLVISYAA